MNKVNKNFTIELIKNESKTNYILYFCTDTFTEIWTNANNSYYCNNYTYEYTREQFLKCVKYLLELKNIVIVFEEIKKDYSLC